jgi:hypothetical protein
VPPQLVGAAPSAINLFSNGGVYDASETGEAAGIIGNWELWLQLSKFLLTSL